MSPANPIFPPSLARTLIAFATRRPDNYCSDIYVMRPDGTGLKRLTYGDVASADPAWSPDGQKIAYKFGSSHPQLHLMNTDGTHPVALTSGNVSYGRPAWSPFLTDTPASVLHAAPAFAEPGGQTTLTIGLRAAQPVARLQFTVQPRIHTLPTPHVSFKGLINRLTEGAFTATSATDAANRTSVFVFSADGRTIPAGEHNLLSLVYEVTPQVPVGTEIELFIDDDALLSPQQEILPHMVEVGLFTVGRKGDLTGDNHIDTRDTDALADILVGKHPYPLYGSLDFFRADVNGDETIDALDVVALSGQHLAPSLRRRVDRPLAPVLLGFGDLRTLESGQLALPILIESDGPIAGMQMVITYTATQLEIGPPVTCGPASGMTVGYHLTQEASKDPHPLGTLRIVLYGATGEVIKPGREAFLLIPVKALREPRPKEDTVDLLNLNVVADIQAQRVPVALHILSPAWENIPVTALMP